MEDNEKAIEETKEVIKSMIFANFNMDIYMNVSAISDVFIMVLLTLFCILSFILPSELSVILIIFPILMIIINIITRYFMQKIDGGITNLKNNIK